MRGSIWWVGVLEIHLPEWVRALQRHFERGHKICDCTAEQIEAFLSHSCRSVELLHGVETVLNNM